MISGAALSYEVLLSRLFEIVQWSHFAAVAISLALLGFGASGTLVSVLRPHLSEAFPKAIVISCAMFGLLAPVSFMLAQSLPFSPLELAWDYWQLAWLSLQFAVLSLPFLFAGMAIGVSLSFLSGHLSRLYAFDLLGAGVGALLVLLLLGQLSAGQSLGAISLIGLLAAWVSAVELGLLRRQWLILVALTLLSVPLVFYSRPLPSAYKGLSQALMTIGAETLTQRRGIEGKLTVLTNPVVAVRHAPGISLSHFSPLPEQVALYLNGNSIGAVTRFEENLSRLSFTDALLTSLPYHLIAPEPEVLLLEAGGGLSVLQALYHGAKRIDLADPLRQRVALLSYELADFSGEIYLRPEINIHPTYPRQFLDASNRSVDLILLDRTISGDLVAPGLDAAETDWLITGEGIAQALSLLKPHGLIAISHWLHMPPRESLRLFSTGLLALRSLGDVDNPARHLIYMRGWKTGVLLIGRSPFTPELTTRIKAYAEARSFDLSYMPKKEPEKSEGDFCEQANRFNRLQAPSYCTAMRTLAGPAASAFVEHYVFDISAPSDDRPYAASYSRVGNLPRLLELEAGAGWSQVDWGFMLLLATLFQAIPLSAVLILLPLAIIRRRAIQSPEPTTSGLRFQTFIYFTAIGLGFMALEIVSLEQLKRYLGIPVYAMSLTLAGFLVFAAVGSFLADRLFNRLGQRAPILIAALLTIIALVQLQLSDFLFVSTSALQLPLRLVIGLLWIAPMAVLLGFPLPLGMRRLAANTGQQRLIPWAWGINGCASVTGTIFASLLMMETGFTATVLVALFAYLVAALVWQMKGINKN